MQKTLLFAVVLLCGFYSPAQETAISLIQKGEQAYHEEKYKTALVSFLQAVNLAKEDNNTGVLLRAYDNLADIYTMAGENTSALQYTLLSLNTYKNNNNYPKMAQRAKDAGMLYSRLREYGPAQQYYSDAYNYANTAGEGLIAADCLTGSAKVAEKQGSHEDALVFYNKALETYTTYNQTEKKAIVLSYIGSVYNNMGDYVRSIESYKEALGYFDMLQDRKNVATTLNDLGRAFAHMGDYNESMELHKQAYLDATTIKFEKALAEACKGLADSYEHLKNYPETVLYRKLYEQKRDTLDARQRLRDMARMQLKFETQKARKEVELIELQKKLQATKENKEVLAGYNFYGLAASVASIVVLTVTILYFVRDKKKMKKQFRRELQKLSKIKKEQHEKIQKVKNIHKELDNRLTGINYFNDEISRKAIGVPSIRNTNEALQAEAGKISEGMNDALWILDEADNTPEKLAVTMCSYTSGYLKNYAVDPVFSVDSNLPRIIISKETRKQLITALKESLSAIAGHARASKVFLGISANNNGMEITLRDNGAGYRENYFNAIRLKKIISGLKFIGGKTDIETVPGWGTTIKFSAPFSGFKIVEV